MEGEDKQQLNTPLLSSQSGPPDPNQVPLQPQNPPYSPYAPQNPPTGSRPQFAPGQPAPTMQPPMRFSGFSDLNSKNNFENLNRHISKAKVKETVVNAAAHTLTSAANTFRGIQDNLSFDQLLEGLVYDGEVILLGSPLAYTGAWTIGQNVKSYSPGKAFLTNKRLLLLSSNQATATTLEQFGDPKKNSTGFYYVTSSHGQVTFYEPFPLINFYSVSLQMKSMSSARVDVVSDSGGCCPCICTKDWSMRNQTQSFENVRTITFGVELPPWHERAMMQIDLDPTVSLSFARDFISAFQKYAVKLAS